MKPRHTFSRSECLGRKPHRSNRRFFSDLLKFRDGLKHMPSAANRCIVILSKLYSWAIVDKGMIDGPSPVRAVRKNKERQRRRYLNDAELQRLNEVLNEAEATGSETPHVVAFFRLLLLTGCRQGEIRGLRWEHVNFDLRQLVLPDSKTGQKEVTLNSRALAVLAELPRIDGNPFVIVSDRLDDKPLTGVQRIWQRLRKRAGLDDVRIHDLRHSFASMVINAGGSLAVVGGLLGHSKAQTTLRYAHLADDVKRVWAEEAGKRAAGGHQGEATGSNVVPMPRRAS